MRFEGQKNNELSCLETKKQKLTGKTRKRTPNNISSKDGAIEGLQLNKYDSNQSNNDKEKLKKHWKMR